MHRGTLRSHTGNRAYTLVEVLVVVTVLGIAGAMVVPAFSQTGTLRVQGAVRMLVADLTMAQSDAIAFQKGRAVVLAPSATDSAYTIAEVNGSNIDLAVDGYEHRRLGGDASAGAPSRPRASRPRTRLSSTSSAARSRARPAIPRQTPSGSS